MPPYKTWKKCSPLVVTMPCCALAWGNEFSKLGQFEMAATHLQQAIIFDPNYSAAWKLLGNAFNESKQLAAALSAYQNGIAVAEKRGDKQAAKEMTVFAKRIEKALAAASNTGNSSP